MYGYMYLINTFLLMGGDSMKVLVTVKKDIVRDTQILCTDDLPKNWQEDKTLDLDLQDWRDFEGEVVLGIYHSHNDKSLIQSFLELASEEYNIPVEFLNGYVLDWQYCKEMNKYEL